MTSLLVCVSVSHGNTRRIAEAMGAELSARIVEPEEVDAAEVARHDLVGFGSGIFTRSFHPRLRRFVAALPEGQQGRAFVIATSGFAPPVAPLERLLASKGFSVIDGFATRAWDTWFPFKPFGGLHKGRPDDDDLNAARTFARGLISRAG
ncbi:MAG: flavodoxin family protein [Propionibacteriales bacterium]|nr:flavodoxin family protein [Propionibacteriales bacterium]